MNSAKKHEKEWFDDETFWKIYAPVMFDEKHWAEVPGVVDSLIKMCKLNPGGLRAKALDLCCGMGRISNELARRGLEVTGVDFSEALLETAREDAAYEKLNIDYIHSDARKFRKPHFFDITLNLYTSFGYFEKPEDDLLLARNVYDSLKPEGYFIIETLGKEIAVRDFIKTDRFERAGFAVFTEYEAVDSWSGLKNRWILIPQDSFCAEMPAEIPMKKALQLPGRIEKTFTQRLYSATELRTLLFEAGFQAVEIYGGWDERPYDQNAAVLIAVGSKM